ncbi:hypothetical protein CAPTEDRAFT_228584 [Capitella teleta]|uniref:TIR domain-containing protein n=1 Tax=Capitella teleta TaxID=283909 RepID=R7V8D9_CAPTE|nr:hypothetical protein CAPTEDRAFT_228584 [Capitella teleta]|eukprot:ELU15118.1 hypothetical protein CAPTEDRAFT_228584 [Capitella teleta]
MGSGSSQGSRASMSQTPRKTQGTTNQAMRSKSNAQNSDVMISYSHADKPIMLKLRDGLEQHGISVWVDLTGLTAGVDFLSTIGQAIIESKMFISLLSENTIKSRYCQDELALAYISNKAIFPVALSEPDSLFPLMDTGMKLQLARFSWNLFLDDEQFEDNLKSLVEKMKGGMEAKGEDSSLPGRESTAADKGKTAINKKLQTQMSFDRKLTVLGDVTESKDFWSKHWGERNSVLWKDFENAIAKDYQKSLETVFTKADRDWLMGIIRRELEVDETDAVFHDSYTNFCTIDDVFQPFWSCIQLQAVESYTMKEVFNMESSVRVQAIENLGKFRSEAVIDALKDLLVDKDNNVRSVAAISLARTGANDDSIIRSLIKCLDEKDRLVRESACLALGHLRSEKAVPKLVHLWRNDFISHVREAAQIALGQIGGEEASKAMHITKVLSDEIRMLTEES